MKILIFLPFVPFAIVLVLGILSLAVLVSPVVLLGFIYKTRNEHEFQKYKQYYFKQKRLSKMRLSMSKTGRK